MVANYKSYLNWLIKFGIVAFATIFIWRKLGSNKDLDSFQQTVKGLNRADVLVTISGLFLLMLLNWLTEAYKWQMQLRDITNISFWSSVQTIFCGVTVGIITPNRIGQYGSRVFFLRPRDRVYGLIAIGVGGLSQFLVINLIAAVAVTSFLYTFKSASVRLVVLISIGFFWYCSLLSLLYFNMNLTRRLISKIRFLNRYRHFLKVLVTYNFLFLTKLLIIGAFRVAILMLQYYIVVHLFIPSVSFWQIMLMAALIVSVQTVLPTIEILDIGVRGATSIYFFGFITQQHTAVLAATTLIWLINLIIPAIIGLFFVYKLKLFEKT